MPVSDTSIESYILLQKDIGRNQKVVLSFIRKYGPITRRELREMIGWEANSVSPRVTELIEAGLVVESGKKYDVVMKRNVYLLEATE